MFDLTPQPMLSLNTLTSVVLALACDPAIKEANNTPTLALYKESSNVEVLTVPEEATLFEVVPVPQGSPEHAWVERQAGRAPMYGQMLQAKLFEQLDGIEGDERTLEWARLYDELDEKQQIAIDKVQARLERLNKALVRASLRSISAAPDVGTVDDRVAGGLRLYPSAVIDLLAERYPMAIPELAAHITNLSSPDLGKSSGTPSGERASTSGGDARSAEAIPPSGLSEAVAEDSWAPESAQS